MDTEAKEQKLSARKRAALWVLLLIVKIIEPTSYSHDYAKELEAVKELIKEV